MKESDEMPVEIKKLMQKLRRRANAKPVRQFPATVWMGKQVLAARQSPHWFSNKDEETGEEVFSSPELTAAYVTHFERLNKLRRVA